MTKAMGKDGEASIDMNKLVKSMRMEMEMLVPLSEDCCIYRVRRELRELNEKAYTPELVSIGPLHHGKKEFEAMEEHKIRYLVDFIKRSNISLEEYMKSIQELEIRLRNSYAESMGHTREEFMKMMAVDGAFIMEYLLKWYFHDIPSNDRIFNKQKMSINVRYDIVLLENQLPFFFLESLFKLCNASDYEEGLSVMMLVHEFLRFSILWKNLELDEILKRNIQVQHIVDFQRICLQPSKPHASRRFKGSTLPTVSALHRAGVKFKSGSSKCLLDIKFDKGTLEVPSLRLTDKTEFLFRNMQPFEQCHNDVKYVNDYIFIMDMLINNAEDVELLVKNGIIENWMEDAAAVATLFNNLGKHNFIDISDFYFSNIVEHLNAYCKIPWHNWQATLKQKYFNNPWTVVSVAAAAFLLLLTVVQTVCSLLQVF